MAEDTWNLWKMTAVGMVLVVSIAVVTGLVVAGWGPREGGAPQPASAPGRVASGAGNPEPGDVSACNQYAKAQAGDKAIEVVKDGGPGAGKGAAIGGMVAGTEGTLFGLDDAKKNDARYVEAYRACMKGRGFSS
ncbi:MAG TPA: hypothetical protein VL948_14150 [Verrucomicrobiae bacterium]|jgi:hypothetical protein|nr:hypothetical protein [Verrucomicrobiae bacterium]